MRKIGIKSIKKAIYLLLGIFSIISAYIIYQNYLKPQYRLSELAPDDYQISIELDFGGFAITKIGQEKLFSNEAIKIIYFAAKKELNSYLQTLPPKGQEALLNSPHILFFLQSDNQFGLVFQPKNKKHALNLTEADFKPLLLSNYQNKYLIVSNNQNLLSTAKDKKIKAKINPYLSFTLNPWLKIGINNAFFSQQFNVPLLTEIQRLFSPLKEANSYSIRTDLNNNNLYLTLQPDKPEKLTATNFKNSLNNLDFNSYLFMGLSDLQGLEKYLSNNPNSRLLWEKLDQQLFLSSQLSLSNLKKLTQPPVTLAFADNSWQILTDKANLNLAKSVLTDYLAQFSPKTITKTLPDNTKAKELVADPDKVAFNQENIKNWEVFYTTEPQANGLGWAEQGNLLMVSNKITAISQKKPLIDCGLSNLINPLNSFFFVRSTAKSPFSSIFTDNFNYLGGFYYPNGEINLCFGLK